MKVYRASYLIPGAQAAVVRYFKNERLAKKWLEPCEAAALALVVDILPKIEEIEVIE